MDSLYSELLHNDISFAGLEEVELSSEEEDVFSSLQTIPPQTSKFTLDLQNSNSSVSKQSTSTRHFEKGKRYEILEAFFRIYLKRDKEQMVNKMAIYTLYSKKIKQNHRVARNALFRHLYSYFFPPNGLSTKLNQRRNNLEFVKGLKIVDNEKENSSSETFQQDSEMLAKIGVSSLFDFKMEDLEPPKTKKTQSSVLIERVNSIQDTLSKIQSMFQDLKRNISTEAEQMENNNEEDSSAIPKKKLKKSDNTTIHLQ